MSTLRRRYKGPTQPKRCDILIPLQGSMLPQKCGDRVFRAGRCIEHYNDWRNQREANRMEPQSVVVLWQREAEAGRPTVDQRRKRQGISQDTQDWLIERARDKRIRRSRAA
jgi:hypothetical protein